MKCEEVLSMYDAEGVLTTYHNIELLRLHVRNCGKCFNEIMVRRVEAYITEHDPELLEVEGRKDGLLRHLILDQRNRTVETNFIRHAQWHLENKERVILGQDRLKGFYVSTVFMGCSCRKNHQDAFETYIEFPDGHPLEEEEYKVRHRTWGAAFSFHERTIMAIKNGE